MFHVYILSDPITGTVFYVGKGNHGRCRLADHVRQARRLIEGKKLTDNNPIKAGIIKRILEAGLMPDFKIVFESELEVEAHNHEIALISAYGRKNNETGCLANMTDGGEGIVGWKMTDETRARKAAASKGRRHSDETKEKMRQAAIGRKHSTLTREKISSVQIGRKATEDTKAKMSAQRKGRKLSEEARSNMSEAAKKREKKPWSESRRAAHERRINKCKL